jgi:putative aldouronate transport system substrate-binding protein
MSRFFRSSIRVCRWSVVALLFVLSSAGLAAETNAVPTIRVMFLVLTEPPADVPMVTQALNKLVEPRIGARIELLPVSQSSYLQQVNLKLAGQASVDLMVTFFDYFPAIAVKGYLLPLDDLIGRYGADITRVLGPNYLQLGRLKDKTYGVTIGSTVNRIGLIARRDVVDKLGISLDKVASLDDLEPILRAVKAAYPGLSPLAPYRVGQSLLDVYNTSDQLGDGFGVLMDNGSTLRVVDWFESAEYAKLLRTIRAWHLAGLTLADSTTNTEEFANLLKYDRVWASIGPVNPQTESQHSQLSGKPIISVAFTPFKTNTTLAAVNHWVIPKNSRNPEKAVQFLNLLYSDPDIVNLLIYGIEGVHYTVGPSGIAETIPPGSGSSGYNLSGVSWELVHQPLLRLTAGQTPRLWDLITANNQRAHRSLAFGFNYDPSPVKQATAAVRAVVKDFKVPLESGAVDPAVQLPAFIRALKEAGIDTIITEKQRQLDAWSGKAESASQAVRP